MRLTILFAALATLLFALSAHAQREQRPAVSPGITEAQVAPPEQPAFASVDDLTRVVRGVLREQSCDASGETNVRDFIQTVWSALDQNRDGQVGRREILRMRENGSVAASGFVFTVQVWDDDPGFDEHTGSPDNTNGAGRWDIEFEYDDYNVVLVASIECDNGLIH